MANSLEKFLSRCNTNTIRANNQFEVVATSGIAEVDAVLENAIMFGEGIELPNRSINYGSVSYKGFEFAGVVPLNLAMGNEASMSIKADVNGEYRRAFLAWMNSVMNADIEGGSVLEGDRSINDKSIVRVHLFDVDNKTVCETYKFFNVRIKDVGGLSLTNNGGDVASFNVGMTFTYWTIETSKNGALTSQK